MSESIYEPCTGQHPADTGCADCAIVRARRDRKIKAGFMACIEQTAREKGHVWNLLADFIIRDAYVAGWRPPEFKAPESALAPLRERWKALPEYMRKASAGSLKSLSNDPASLNRVITIMEAFA